MRSKYLDRILEQPSVQFDKEGHTYRTIVGNDLYTGCTTIAGAWQKNFLQAWYAKEVILALGWYDQYKDRRKRPAEELKLDKLRFEALFESLKTLSASDYYTSLTEAKGAAKRKADIAKESGTIAHDCVEKFINTRLDPALLLPESPTNKEANNAFTSFVVWEKNQKIDWLASEEVVNSNKHRVAGRIDALAIYNALPSIIDIKTSGQISEDYLLQLAGYDIMLAEMGFPVRQWVIVRTPKDGSPVETLTINNLEDMEFFRRTFLHQREAHKFYAYMESHFQDQNGKMKVDIITKKVVAKLH